MFWNHRIIGVFGVPVDSIPATLKGAEYQDAADAEYQAMVALPEIAHSRHPARDLGQVSATESDEAGAIHFRAPLALTVERVSTGSGSAGGAAT
jgi:hypothetical protein